MGPLSSSRVFSACASKYFPIGFGPRLWGFRAGTTDYRISALPLGGYVRMAGDNPSEERTGEPDEFLSKPRWQRVCDRPGRPHDEPAHRDRHLCAFICGGSSQQYTYADKPVVDRRRR